jgi:hypothetical protein
MNTYIEVVNEKIQATRTELLSHPVYARIKNLSDLQRFSESHVFAVWDFMSLLKSLQLNLTCVSLPWMPVGSADTRYLINEIVTGEESDVDQAGNRISHFELYLQAMNQMGASTSGIQSLISSLQNGNSIVEAIAETDLPESVKRFLTFTFEVIQDAPVHVQAAVFTFGREDLIPDMFMRILEQLHAESPEQLSIFHYYIERHIEVDGGHHTHLAQQMVASLCGNDPQKWQEAIDASLKSLEIRKVLWDGIVQSLN